MKLDALYRDVILDHHKAPRGRENLPRVDASSEGKNPSCGDEVTVNVLFDGPTVEQVQINCVGCSICSAAGSMLCEVVPGKTVSQLEQLAAALRQMLQTGDEPAGLDIGDMDALCGVSQHPVRVKCAMLPVATLIEAFQHAEKNPAI